mmetsp:Transcript_13780/g.41609  ORF Transcript_13780/g.41609 Transcript_13780/m.41609 type:complete len:256 (-) Transcript_13780:655-1422(-)
MRGMLRPAQAPVHPLAPVHPFTSARPCAATPSARRVQRRLRRLSAEDEQSRGATELPERNSNPRMQAEEATDFVKWGGTLPSGRRAVIGGLTGLGIALVGNLGGLSSFLLSLDGGALAGRLRADVLIPVRGYRRALNTNTGYEFLYPSPWLVDQRLFRRAAEQAEKRRSLDPPALRAQRGGEDRRVAEPQVAYGPPGTSGEENVSIIAAPIQSPFRRSTPPSSVFPTAKQCPRRRDASTEGIIMHCDGACQAIAV